MTRLVNPPIRWRHLSPVRREHLARARLGSTAGHLVEGSGLRAWLVPDTFDSAHFGRRMGKLDLVWLERGATAEQLVAEAADLGFEHLAVRVPSTEPSAIQLFEQLGFRYMDTHATLEAACASPHDVPPTSSAIEVRGVVESDIEALMKLGENVFRLSRYEWDTALERDAVRSLVRDWIFNDCRGRADLVLTALLEGRISGFLACLWRPPEAENGLLAVAEIDLVTVAPEAQGRAVGRALVYAAQEASVGRADMITVQTQGGNIPAWRLYASCGFKPVDLSVTLHWSGESGRP